MPSTWPLTRCPPSSSPSRSERSRLSLVPRCHVPAVVTRQRLRRHVDGKERAIALLATLHDRQARTGTGDGRTDVDGGGIVAAGDCQAA